MQYSSYVLPKCKSSISHQYVDQDDLYASKIYPQDEEPLTPMCTQGDGNCLYRAMSLLLFGDQDKHIELRARVVCELSLNEQFYLSGQMIDEGNAEQTVDRMSTRSKHGHNKGWELHTIYQQEVLDTCKLTKWGGFWQIAAFASVLGQPELNCWIRVN